MISERAKRVGMKELAIFDYFEIDNELPKYKDAENTFSGSILVHGNTISIDQGTVPQAWISAIGGNSGEVDNTRISLKTRFANWLLSGRSTKTEKAPAKKITIVEFFTTLTKNYEELSPIGEIAEHYEKALIQAKTMGQTALLERLKDCIDAARGEAHLVAMGLRKYVTEKQVVELYEKVGTDKNLKLTWIKNFGRIIPEAVYEIKKDVDERKIFDNYVILHYDPKENGEKLTKKEKEKKKDPILFGVIKNSKKLYFVADWKDEYCDLTVDEMFKILKEKVLKINNTSVKSYIDNIKVE